MAEKSVGLIILLLIIGALALSSGFTQQVVDGCQFIQPQFGRIECEPVSNVPIDNSYTMKKVSGFGWAAYQWFAKCGDDENSPSCSYFLSWTGVEAQITSLQWRYCSVAWDASSCQRWNVIYPNPTRVPTGEVPIVTNLNLGSIIEVWVDCGFLGLDCPTQPPRVISRYIPYGLNVYDSGGKYRYNTQSCDLGDLSWEDRYNVCTQSDGTACQKIKESDRLNFDDWVNYLSTWVYAPIDMNNKVVTWQGQQAYCQVNQIYSIGSFETENNCYKYPKSLIGSVDCCPGMTTANSYCGDDFQWHPIQIGECSTNQDCIDKYGSSYYCDIDTNTCVREVECVSDLDCPYSGQDFCDYSMGIATVTRFGCVGGKCDIKESVSVDCCPPYDGCQEGYICNPNKGYICEKQEGPDIVCGDGVCSRPYEDEINCPQDCEFEWPEWVNEYLFFIIFPILGALIGYRKKKKIVDAAIYGIGGLLVAFVVQFLYHNWLAVILGGTGLIILGVIIFAIYIVITSWARKR